MFIDDAYAHLYTLSLQGLGVSTPNPNVSAAIYGADGSLISDGFHNRQSFSRSRRSCCAEKSWQLQRVGQRLVVSLEPCAHTGTTPPCVQAIIDAGIAKVIYAVGDPNPIAAGGAKKLHRCRCCS